MGIRNAILQYTTLWMMCILVTGLKWKPRERLKINKGPLLGYIDSLDRWLPVGLQSIQFRPPYKVRIVRRFLMLSHIPLIPCQLAIPFLRYDFSKIWPWKSKVKVMGEGNVEKHKVGVTPYRFTSLLFHVNRPSHSWDTTFSKFDLENPR